MTMIAEREETLRAEAIRWHLRIADGSAEDWEAFVAWLGAEVTHAYAYDAIEAADAEAGSALLEANPKTLHAANDDGPIGRRRWWWGGAAAAALVLALTVGPQLMQRDDPYTVATAAGQTRMIALASGDRIALNGNSSITLDHHNLRLARLERGEAVFMIRHDPAAPFMLQVGDKRIEDVGTVFNVVRDKDGVRVAVAEGMVLYNPDGEAIRLAAGESLHDRASENLIVRSRVDPASVGAWRAGRLSYAATPLALVVADLERATGERVSLAGNLSTQPFTGTITLDSNRARLFEDLAGLLDARATHSSAGWRLVTRGRARN